MLFSRSTFSFGISGWCKRATKVCKSIRASAKRQFSTNRIIVEKSTYSNVIDQLQERGLLSNITSPHLRDIVEQNPKCSVYAGYDPTADSLHVGHLISVVSLAFMQKQGIKPIAIVGGATGLVGDPSGRSDERPLLTKDQVQHNLNCLKASLSGMLGSDVQVMNNYDWYENMGSIDFLRDVGKHFRIGTMLAKDSVKSRIEAAGMSFTEFSYQLLQAYDFNYLYKHHNCKIQIGGSDQWGNITAGIDLIHKLHGQEAYGLTVPLLTTANGAKISKSAGNAVWLSSHRASPYQLYQWAMRLTDDDIEPMLKKITMIPVVQIKEILAEHLKHPEDRYGHKILASAVVEFVHGTSASQAAEAASLVLFGGKSFEKVRSSDLISAFKDTGASTIIEKSNVVGSKLSAVAMEAKLANSKGELKRIADGGGIYVNNMTTSLEHVITESDLVDGQVLLLRSGKKNYHLVITK